MESSSHSITEEEFNKRRKLIIDKLNYYGYFIEDYDINIELGTSNYEKSLNSLIANVFATYCNIPFNMRLLNKFAKNFGGFMRDLFKLKEDETISKGKPYMYRIID